LEKKTKDKKGQTPPSPQEKRKKEKKRSYGRVTTKQKHVGLKNAQHL